MLDTVLDMIRSVVIVVVVVVVVFVVGHVYLFIEAGEHA